MRGILLLSTRIKWFVSTDRSGLPSGKSGGGCVARYFDHSCTILNEPDTNPFEVSQNSDVENGSDVHLYTDSDQDDDNDEDVDILFLNLQDFSMNKRSFSFRSFSVY